MKYSFFFQSVVMDCAPPPKPGSILADTSFKDRMKLDKIDTSEQTVNSKCEGKKRRRFVGKDLIIFFHFRHVMTTPDAVPLL